MLQMKTRTVDGFIFGGTYFCGLINQNSAECMWRQRKQSVKDGPTDDRPSDPYVALCFTGAIKMAYSWGWKFVAVVFFLMIHTEYRYFVGNGIRGSDPQQENQENWYPTKIKPSAVNNLSCEVNTNSVSYNLEFIQIDHKSLKWFIYISLIINLQIESLSSDSVPKRTKYLTFDPQVGGAFSSSCAALSNNTVQSRVASPGTADFKLRPSFIVWTNENAARLKHVCTILLPLEVWHGVAGGNTGEGHFFACGHWNVL